MIDLECFMIYDWFNMTFNMINCDTFKLNMGLEEKSCYIGLSFVITIS